MGVSIPDGIPTARSVDHVAVTVPRLDEAVRFLVDILGAVVVYEEGPLGPSEDLSAWLRIPAEATCRIAMLRFGPTLNLELFEYQTSDQRTEPPANSDVGGHHIAIYVDDIEAAYRHLRDTGRVTFQGTPRTVTDGPIAGTQWVYFTSPWGMQFELVSTPVRLPYEASTTPKVQPATAWDVSASRPRGDVT
jgi:catechol 2,3-dioxygenase-like lactoylglutathione lyase family enzyme